MPPLRARLDFVEYVSISVGMALACGGYAVLGRMLEASGPRSLLLAIGAAALLCLTLALAMGELAGRFPSAPGIRTYLKTGLGDSISVGFSIGLLVLVVLFGGIEGHVLALAVRQVVPLGETTAGLAIICTVVALNLLGVDLPRRAQLAITVVLLAIWFTVIGIAFGGDAAPSQRSSDLHLTGFAELVVGCVFLFTGFEWVAPLGRRPEAYRREIPFAMLAAVPVLTAAFAGLVLAMARTAAPLPLPDIPHVALGRHVLPRFGAAWMVLVSLLSAFTTLNAGLMGMARLTYALAREKVLPRLLTTISPRTGVPWVAVVAIGGAAVTMALVQWRFGLVEASAQACGALYCWIYGAYLTATARLRRRHQAERGQFTSHIGAPLLWGGAALFFVLGVVVAADRPAGSRAATTMVLLVLAIGSSASWLHARRAAKKVPARTALAPQAQP